MPRNGLISTRVYSPPNTLTRWESTCACGARAGTVNVDEFGRPEPLHIAGLLIDACTCPRCITCTWVLDAHGRCDNLDCPLLGTLILIPD